MKFPILKLILVTQVINLHGQNLVPNPSFESYTSCPNGSFFPNEITLAVPWTNPTGCSPDYFNQCGTVTYGVPANGWGSQTARTGNAYAGFIGIDGDASGVREYIEVKLNDTLIAGGKYLVEFYVSRADQSLVFMRTIGAFFSANQIADTNGCAQFNNIPQIVYSGSNLSISTLGWTRIQDTLLAVGGELYLTIGNFNSDATSDSIRIAYEPPFGYAYYYVEDVSVVLYSLNGMDIQYSSFPISLFPNPSHDNITLEFSNSNHEEFTLTIYNTQGQLVRKMNNITSEKIEIDNISDGFYFYRLESYNKNACGTFEIK